MSDASLQTTWSGVSGQVLHVQDAEWLQGHSREVEALIGRLLEPGMLRALQVTAVHSSLCIDIRRLAASGLQHLALACERLRLEHACGGPPPVPSIHLITWVCPDGAAWVPGPRTLNIHALL